MINGNKGKARSDEARARPVMAAITRARPVRDAERAWPVAATITRARPVFVRRLW